MEVRRMIVGVRLSVGTDQKEFRYLMGWRYKICKFYIRVGISIASTKEYQDR
jgi:hypothetical protein